MTLKIITINHGTFEISEALTSSVGEVKVRIGEILRKQGKYWEPALQRLVLNGEELSRDEQLLGQIKMMGKEATIHLTELTNHPDSDLPSAERFLHDYIETVRHCPSWPISMDTNLIQFEPYD